MTTIHTPRPQTLIAYHSLLECSFSQNSGWNSGWNTTSSTSMSPTGTAVVVRPEFLIVGVEDTPHSPPLYVYL